MINLNIYKNPPQKENDETNASITQKEQKLNLNNKSPAPNKKYYDNTRNNNNNKVPVTPIQPINQPAVNNYQQVPGKPVQYAIPVPAGQPTAQPVVYQYVTPVPAQLVIIQQQTTNESSPPQTIIIEEKIIEEKKVKKKQDNCCYCQGPRQSPCGCLDRNEEYCCFIVCFAYVLMSLSYILTCLWIISFCSPNHVHSHW